uniref:Uncharacterized protein n=1 Tax=Octopus bimaculoides TaxID=37653 RepID=A0A0L8G304_OCTBM
MADSNFIIVTGDSSWGQHNDNLHDIYRDYGYDSRNEKDEGLLEFCDTWDLTICKTYFKKGTNYLITYQSGKYRSQSQTDYIPGRKRDREAVVSTGTFPGKECMMQHRLVDGGFRVRATQKQNVKEDMETKRSYNWD